jgi:hypothetical protein
MAKHTARTTEIIRETEYSFVAHLDNGMMRYGIKGMACKDVRPFSVPSIPDNDAFDDYVSELFK